MSSLADVRQALRDALVGGVIDSDRAHSYPRFGAYPTPCAWVGRPTIRSGRGVVSVSFPIALAVDGANEAQMAALDDETPRLWAALSQVPAPSGGKAEVTSATPEQFGPEGSTVLGAVLTVSLDLSVRTFCTPTIST